MTPPGQSRQERPTDFFISYSPADERWASWIAWQLEAAGHRTMMQAWDFVPGTNFIDFMDRGLSEAKAVVAVLSSNYLRSRYGRLEWMAALRADPDDPARKLVTVRVEDCEIDGLLSTITYVDLVGIDDPGEARGLLMRRIEQALAGHARPQNGPGFPGPDRGLPSTRAPLPGTLESAERRPEEAAGERAVRRAPVAAPPFPVADGGEGPRDHLSVLHVSGPRFGRTLAEPGEPTTATELQDRIWSDVTRLADSGVPRPDLLVVTGNLTHSGSRREFAEALSFLTSLRALLGLEAQRVVVVPGTHDVTRAACQAYFSSCEADDIQPQPPYWPKWRHYAGLFKEFYQGIDALIFDSAQPWTLFPIPDLRVVVAGLNSTLPQTHRESDRYGQVGRAQAAWFNERLRHFEEEGWIRLAAVEHTPVPGEPGALRDPETVDMLLSGHVNLFFQGTQSEFGAIPLLDSGVPSVPALGPGRHQSVVLGRDGLERWIPEDAARRGSERLGLPWSSVHGTFPAPAAEIPLAPPVPELGPETTRTVDPVPDPTAQLLDRLTEACETRFERATIRRIVPSPGEDGRSDPPHLLLTHLEDGFVRQYRIGAHVGQVTEADVEAFVRHVHADGTDHGSELVYLGPAPARSLREDALRRGIRVRSLTEFQGLVDLSEYVTAQTGRLSAGGLYPPTLYVPQRYRELDRFRPDAPSNAADGDVHDDVVGEMLRLLAADHGRFLLLLGDFGRGKTFALRELARRISEDLPHVIPILIELRALDKAHSVDGLVAAHLANHGEELIDLKAFHYMLRQGRIVLLFDGFDELVTRMTYDRATDHLDTLLQAAQDKAKIVVASRTQHFKSQAQVLTALGEKVGVLPHRRVLGLEDFAPPQVRSYLVNRYGDEDAAEARLTLLSGIEELLALTSNPRMLSFIADLPADRLRAVAQARRAVSPADLYHEILSSWLAYEADRVGGAGGPSGLKADDMWRAVGTLALRLWEGNEQFLRLAELTDVGDTLTGLAGGRMSPQQVTHAVGAGSLLVRTDEGLFGFIHTSVMEWLVARHIADEFANGAAPDALTRRALTQLAVDFLCDLADARACQDWAATILADPDADDIARANAIRVTTRLRTPAHTDLRGARLQGEDLSYRDLQEVDLTGADLSDAQLVGANLSRAVLRDASLAGARLDEAVLTGADLRGADLSRARLARADLRDVTVDGSTWTRAALVDAVLPDRIADRPELREAAIAPGRPIDLQVRPAAVGVPYGFHFQTSRLPQPLAYSPGGSVLAVGNEDGGVLVCDAVTGTPLRTLQGHTDRAYAVVFNASGDLLVTGAADGTVRLWDLATGHTTHTFTVHSEGVWPVVVGGRAPSGAELVAAGAADGMIRIWDAESGALLHELSGHTAPVYTAVFDPAAPLMVTGDSAGAVRVWDLTTGELRQELTGHRGAVYRAVFHPNGALLAAGDAAGVVRLWDIRTGEINRELLGHTGRVYAIAFHPDGNILVTGDTAGSVRVWDDEGDDKLLNGHGGAIYQATFSPDGGRLATADSSGSIRLWDPRTGRQRLELTGHRGAVWPFAFRPDGAQLATSGNDGTARLWDAETGQCRVVLRGHGRRITGITFSPDGGMLASSGNDGLVRLWDPRTGRMIRELRGVADNLTSAAFNTRDSQLATATNDGGVHLWQAGTGTFERELNAETDHVWAQAFSPNGTVLATANDDDTVRLWYWTTGRETVNLADHRGRVRSIDFHPDGDMVATGCDDGLVRLWHPRTGELTTTLSGHTARVYRVAFSPSGEALASASNDGTVRLWDPFTGEPLHTLTGHTGRLWTTAFHPSGTLLATAGDDMIVRLWNPSTGEPLHTLTGHTRRIWSVAFSPDGTVLATAGDDGAIILWDVTDPTAPTQRATLLGLAEGWAAVAPDGRYKWEGNATAEFWYAVAMCRFEPGELDPYLRDVHQLPLDAPF